MKKLFTIGLTVFVLWQSDAATNVVPILTATNATRICIVTLRREADQDGCAVAHGLKRRAIWRHALNGFAAELDDAAVAKLKRDHRVLAVEPDGQVAPCLLTFPQLIPGPFSVIGVSNYPPAQINGFYQPLNVDVAVMDTGIDGAHPDLTPAVTHWVGFTTSTNLVNNYNGLDWDGHGTFVAGIIGALDNSIGVVGVAPGVRLWSIQWNNPQSNSTTNVLNGMDYVAQHADQISVVNCSFTSATPNGNPVVALEQAVHRVVNLGVVVVAGVGNNGYNGSSGPKDIAGNDGILSSFDTNGDPIVISSDDFIPASLPEVMAVSAMDPVNWVVANFSNYCQENKVPSYVNSPGLGIDVTAPGGKYSLNLFNL